MDLFFRRRSTFHLPITLSACLIALNVTLMVCWIIVLSRGAQWTALAVGVLAFTLALAGIIVWLVLTIKEIRLNHRQANFVDSVTHELKSPIAALQLYLQTLRMRNLDADRRDEFHATMQEELNRLDQLINQLLEVGRLDAIGQNEMPEDVSLPKLFRESAEAACRQHNVLLDETFTFEVAPLAIHTQQIVLRLILSNLLDNAVKYGGLPPKVHVTVYPVGSRARIRITNNGASVPYEDRKKIFQIFYRGGSELQRTRKGTGLGLYIVSTLIRRLKGWIQVTDRTDGKHGCTFEAEIPEARPIESSGIERSTSSASPPVVETRS
jgi:signal transduction histidine kinase